MKIIKHIFRTKNKGAALVIVLSVVVVMSAIVLGLAVAMRMERQAAHFYAERARADLLAREGIEYVKSSIKEATDTSVSGYRWTTSPGQIITNSSLANGVVALYSGTAASTDTNAPDLNRIVRTDDRLTAITGEVQGSTNVMRVAWIYVYKDGTHTLTTNAYNATNPIIGRFAYWADDESSRIDLNTAWKRIGNPNSVNHPSRVNLLAITNLTEVGADLIHDAATNVPFNTPDEARRLAAVSDIISSNRFFLSHHAFSSALNPWGNPKLILTTQKTNLPPEILALGSAATNYYLDVVKTDNADPGWYSELDSVKVIAQLNKLYALLSTNSWPIFSNNFVSKYSELNRAQLALDILEYVRSAESARNVVLPLRLRYANGTYTITGITDPQYTNTIIGSTRRPMVDEVAFWMGPIQNGANANLKTVTYKLKVEVCLPKVFGINLPELFSKNEDMNVSVLYPIVVGGVTNSSYYMSLSFSPEQDKFISANTVQSEDVNNVYVVQTWTGTKNFNLANIANPPSTFTNRPTTVYSRIQFGAGNGEPPEGAGTGLSTTFWDIAPSPIGQGPDSTYLAANIRVPVDGEGVSESLISSAQASDPRVNKYRDSWTNAPNTLGSANIKVLMSGIDPPQDSTTVNVPADVTQVSDASMYKPAPRGSTNTGRLNSLAELGYIGTGVGASIPWRSIRLQPTPSSQTIPDWALLELFSAPFSTNNGTLYTPKPNSFAGRVNINSRMMPFTNMSRMLPIQALFKDSTNDPTFSNNKMAAVITNIMTRQYAAGGRNFGGTNGFLTAAEMIEIRGFADEGETSEKRLFGIVDLASVQGSVFRIYSIGQSLKQMPNGSISVQAEKSAMAIVERSPTDGSLRTVYWKIPPL